MIAQAAAAAAIEPEGADIEPEEGVYNWTLPDALALSINASGRMAVYKVNANVKPAWLYGIVPWSNVTWTTEQHDGRTAMYWHPAYVAALTRRIAAQAEWLATSPHGKYYSYVRQTWAAIGEEGLYVRECGTKVTSFTGSVDYSWAVGQLSLT